MWLLALGWRRRRGVLLADLGLNGLPAPLAVTVPLAALGAAFLATAAWYSQDFSWLRIHGC